MYPSSFYEKHLFKSSRFIHPNKTIKPIKKIKKETDSSEILHESIESKCKTEHLNDSIESKCKTEHLNEFVNLKTPDEGVSTKKETNIYHLLERLEKIENILYNGSDNKSVTNVDYVIDSLIEKLKNIKDESVLNTVSILEPGILQSEIVQEAEVLQPEIVQEAEVLQEPEVSTESEIVEESIMEESENSWYFKDYRRNDTNNFEKYYNSPKKQTKRKNTTNNITTEFFESKYEKMMEEGNKIVIDVLENYEKQIKDC